MAVVVTGASGHVGANLVRELLAGGRGIRTEGSEVRALVHRDHQALEGLPVEIVHGDVRDLDSLRRAFAGAETVFHAAAYISLLWDDWPLLEAVNVHGVRNVVQACLECGVRRLVHFSSIHALEQEPLDVPVDEARPLVTSPRCPPYDCSKAAGELEIRKGLERGLDAVILYPTGIIGPHDFRPSHFGAFLVALACGRIPALVTAGFDWVDARDVARGALQAGVVAPPGGRYLLSGQWVSVRDLAAAVQAHTGVKAPKLVCPLGIAELGAPLSTAWAQKLGRRPLFTSVSLHALKSCNRRISYARAARELGYHPRPFQETIGDTLEWFYRAGRIPKYLKDPP